MTITSQKSCRYLICTTSILLVLLVCFAVWQKAEGRIEASTTMPALRGEEAVSYLKEQGLYGSLSEAMSAARYSVQWSKNTPWKESAGAYYANNPSQQMTAFFTPSGIHLRSQTTENKQDWKVGMKLSAYGYGEELTTVAAGEVKVEGNRVEITRQNGLTEWFVNQADGIEHGFKIAAPPSGRKSGTPLRLRLELEGNLQAKQLADANGIELRGARGEPVLRYDRLHVFDAEGKELEANLRAAGKQVRLEVEESEAVYPLTIDPTFSQQQKLIASDNAPGDRFGWSVAISGETLVVGASSDDIGANMNQGSAYVFVRTGAAWSEQQKLSASDGAADDNFGNAVAISGETLVIGANGTDAGTNGNQGSAYVFVRTGAAWSEQQKLSAVDGAAGDLFGGSVAISGETLVIAAQSDDTGANQNQGSAYVFVRTGSSWTQQQKLTAADGAAGDQFGSSVAISGETLVVGAFGSRIGPNILAGSAYVFVHTGAVWSQQQKLIASDAIDFDRFGTSVAISGETIVVGTPERFDFAYRGSAYVFVRTGASWSQQQKLAALDGAPDDMFGGDVAISGETIVIGARFDDIGANRNQGSAYVFVRTGTAWSQQQKLTAANGTGEDYFGNAVAISGETIVVGSYNDRVSGSSYSQGSAYVFACGGAQHWVEQAKTIATDGAVGDEFGFSVSISGETIVVGARVDDVGANINQGSAYVFVRTGMSWSQQQKLIATDGAAADVFGGSVAVSGETIVVGSSSDDLSGVGGDQGSAYVFVRTGTNWSQQQKLTASDSMQSDAFGTSVGISGETIVVGAQNDTIGGNLAHGSAYVFVRTGMNWIEQQKLLASDGTAFDHFGFSVAISGETLVVGAYGNDFGANQLQGAAYVFVRTGTSWSQQQKLTASVGAAFNSFGISVAVSGETLVVGAMGDDVGANINQGSAYVFVRTGTSWSQQQKLTATDGAAGDDFGGSVAISGETVVAGAPFDDVGANQSQGSAYVFVRTGTNWSQQQKLSASDGAAGDQFGTSVAISGESIIIGAKYGNTGANDDQGSAYVFFRDCIVINYDVCLQDDNNPATVLQFNSTTGEYRFCCGGTTYTGTGVASKRGSTITLQHKTSDRRLQASIDTSQNRGTASLQSPPGVTRCLITDRDTRDNTCSCR